MQARPCVVQRTCSGFILHFPKAPASATLSKVPWSSLLLASSEQSSPSRAVGTCPSWEQHTSAHFQAVVIRYSSRIHVLQRRSCSFSTLSPGLQLVFTDLAIWSSPYGSSIFWENSFLISFCLVASNEQLDLLLYLIPFPITKYFAYVNSFNPQSNCSHVGSVFLPCFQGRIPICGREELFKVAARRSSHLGPATC